MDLDIDFNNIGKWPTQYMIGACVIAFVLVIALGGYLVIKDFWGELEKTETKEAQLKESFEVKQHRATNLDAYKKQMKEMEKRFGTMLKQLPKKTEVADLLVEVSQTGLGNGLEFSLFQPQSEVKQEFYAELPISIIVTGTYHQFSGFASEIAALPRIVTLHDIKMLPFKDSKSSSGDNQKLTVSLMAKTYRYMDEDEVAGNSGKRRKRRR